MRIVIIRHGEPDYEKDCLTELGLKQADAAAKRLLEEGIEEIYSSTCGRALETARAFSKASGINDVHPLDFIREIRYGCEGDFYGKKWNPWYIADGLVSDGQSLQLPEWRDSPLFSNNFATEDVDKIAVESDKWLATLGYEREGLYYRCKRADDKQKTIALFCHGGASSAFFARVFNLPFPFLCAVQHFSFTAISILRFDRTPGKLSIPVIELMNDDRHLEGIN